MTIITEEEEEGGQETRKGRDIENIADKIKVDSFSCLYFSYFQVFKKINVYIRQLEVMDLNLFPPTAPEVQPCKHI